MIASEVVAAVAPKSDKVAFELAVEGIPAPVVEQADVFAPPVAGDGD
jgi:hypothetical protein